MKLGVISLKIIFWKEPWLHFWLKVCHDLVYHEAWSKMTRCWSNTTIWLKTSSDTPPWRLMTAQPCCFAHTMCKTWAWFCHVIFLEDTSRRHSSSLQKPLKKIEETLKMRKTKAFWRSCQAKNFLIENIMLRHCASSSVWNAWQMQSRIKAILFSTGSIAMSSLIGTFLDERWRH